MTGTCGRCGGTCKGRLCRPCYVVTHRRKARQCPWCAASFTPRYTRQKFCTKAHANESLAQRRRVINQGLHAMHRARFAAYSARLKARIEGMAPLEIWRLAYQRAWQAAWMKYRREGAA